MRWLCIRNFLLFGTCFGFLSGCALTRETLPFNYRVTDSLSPTFYSKPADAIQVGIIQDKRGEDDPQIIFHKTNGNGYTAKGAYAAERPISDIVREAIGMALIKANFNVKAQNAPYQLYGNMLDLSYRVIQGMMTVEFRPKITVQLYLKETRSGRIVWSETFIGRSSVETVWGGNEIISNGLNAALDDLVKQIVTSDDLKCNLTMTVKRDERTGG